jgi:hypothetical protein
VSRGYGVHEFPDGQPYQGASAEARDIFVTRFSPDGSKLAWSTYLGGGNDELAFAIALDNSGNVYVGGSTASTDFPSSNGWQTSNKGSADGTVSAFSADGSALIFSSYIGGTSADIVYALTVNCTAGLIVAGSTQSSNFPGTLGAAPALNYAAGAAVGFVAKIAAGTSSSTLSQGGIVNAATSRRRGVAGVAGEHPGANLAGSGRGRVHSAEHERRQRRRNGPYGADLRNPGQINFQLPYDCD